MSTAFFFVFLEGNFLPILKTPIDISLLYNGILEGNLSLLSKAITLVESSHPTHRQQASELIDCILPHTGNSIRIGFSGVPGVGKSTLMESLGLHVLSQGKKIAVLAIDPSSHSHKGSILGDKTRMEELAKHPNAFIRPTPSSGILGGVAFATYETVLLCEAFGFDTIFIETVGVGQSETQVSSLTDVFVLLTVPHTGDELQGIKRGIMELAHILFINKIEQDETHSRHAIDAKTDLVRASQLLPKTVEFWTIPVLMGSALSGFGMEILWKTIEQFIEEKKLHGVFFEQREQQRMHRFYGILHHLLVEKIQRTLSQNKELQEVLSRVKNEDISPLSAGNLLLNKIRF